MFNLHNPSLRKAVANALQHITPQSRETARLMDELEAAGIRYDDWVNPVWREEHGYDF